MNENDELSKDEPDSGPLKFDYAIGSVGQVHINVTGPERNIAEIKIYSGSELMWEGTLTQITPDAVVPGSLTIGDLTVKDIRLHMQVPTATQLGFVRMEFTIVTENIPDGQKFDSVIAHWTLVSSS